MDGLRHFEEELQSRLDALRARGLYRELHTVASAPGPCIRLDGKVFLNFSSNDYLGLANEPALKQVACSAAEDYGAGAAASRLICGSLAPHEELDRTLAEFKGTEAALSFSTGYAAAVGTIAALVGKGDVIILDRLVHASMVDAARFCGARLRVFAHNNLENLETKLKWATTRIPGTGAAGVRPRVLVVTESVFSMDGDCAPLRELVELKERYGAWLMVDEAHATGLYGPNRRGLAEELAVSQQIEVQMGTLGKALGASGGYICGSRRLVEYLINKARSFIFSTAPVPAAAAAATAGVRFVASNAGQERCSALWQRISQLASALNRQGPARQGAIFPLIVGNEREALEAAAALGEDGIFVPAIRYPTVARGSARLRVTLSARHTPEHIEQLVNAIKGLKLQFTIPPLHA